MRDAPHKVSLPSSPQCAQEMKKSVFDAWNGYHSVPLHPDDTHFTTFITPWGRYRYLTAPQGYKASGDGYTARFDGLTEGIKNKTKCVDDTLMWSEDIAQAFTDAANWLTICGANGIILNPEKFVFAKDTVQFAGFEIGLTTVKPARKFTKAIVEFPTPTSTTDVRSWFGLVNQVAYTFSRADTMAPFRDLLKPLPSLSGPISIKRHSRLPSRRLSSRSRQEWRSLRRIIPCALLLTGASLG